MKTIIAGSRTITGAALLAEAIGQSGFHITEVVYGGANGVDRLGFDWAITRCPSCSSLKVEMFDADNGFCKTCDKWGAGT